MKKNLFIILMLISLLLPINIFAANKSTTNAIEHIDINKKANLTIDFNDTGYDFLEDGETGVKIYRISSVSKDFKFTILDKYNSLSLNLKDIEDSESWDSIANTINSYIISEEIEEDFFKETDSGKATFNDLELGFYLIVPNPVDTEKYLLDYKPYILNLPYLEEDGTWNYTVTSRPKPIEPTYYPEYHVFKTWLDNGRNRPTSIDVQIYKDGVIYEEITLSKENNWHYTWYPKTDGDFTVTETVPEGYSVRVISAANSFTINNYKEEITPRTYDDINLYLYLFLGSLISLIILFLIIRKRSKKINDI